MAYPPSRSGSRSAVERLRRRLRPTRWRYHLAASRTRSPTTTTTTTVTTRITTTANRQHGRLSMRVLPPSLWVPLPLFLCFLRNDAWCDLTKHGSYIPISPCLLPPSSWLSSLRTLPTGHKQYRPTSLALPPLSRHAATRPHTGYVTLYIV